MSSLEEEERRDGGKFSRRSSSRLPNVPELPRERSEWNEVESSIALNVPCPPYWPFMGFGVTFLVGGGSYKTSPSEHPNIQPPDDMNTYVEPEGQF